MANKETNSSSQKEKQTEAETSLVLPKIERNIDLSEATIIENAEITLLPRLSAMPNHQLDTTPIDLKKIYHDVADVIATTPDQYKCIMFTDLVGSTQYKKDKGHTKGFMRNRMFCDICETAVDRNSGLVVKRLGDGVMAVFETAIDSVLAAMLIVNTLDKERKRIKKMVGKMDCRIGITCGYVKEIPGASKDYIGHAMDKGARIEGAAKTNQVLIDEIVYGLIHTKIKDYAGDIRIGSPKNINLKGIGVSTLYEVSPKERGLVSSTGYKLRHMFD